MPVGFGSKEYPLSFFVSGSPSPRTKYGTVLSYRFTAHEKYWSVAWYAPGATAGVAMPDTNTLAVSHGA